MSGERRAATAKLWGSADYSGLARRLESAADALVDAAAPRAGERVLDLAAGTGNVAIRAAARGARVTAADIAPRMVQLGRERTGPAVEWIEADVEDLPLPDDTVDVALSAFGLIFAPRPEVALTQLTRVLVPSGRLAFTAWASDGYIAARARTIREFVPPDPTYPDTLSWGDPDILEQRLAWGFSDIRIERRSLPWHFDSPAQMSAFYTAHSAAYLAAKQAAGDRADQMVAAIERQASPDGGPVQLEAEYLLAQALRS
ncbi:MAG TPA: methyltransferase domain-containing protein [Pseudonocardiaceae bacterium]|nr:methyltransferase domain-containing protein [Pseudonocardiaceae bacterium]